MLRALFPAEGQPITIKQGRTGDCYLLAALDCLLNGGVENRQYIKKLFRQDANGNIELKLLNSNHSKYLVTNAFERKKYKFRKKDRYEIFTFTPEALERISKERDGVQTNCFAIKILEHIVPYYFISGDLDDYNVKSILAHSNKKRQEQGTLTTEFVAELLGINTNSNLHFWEIVRIKWTDPDKPIYFSMQYDINDTSVNASRHAYKLKSIVPYWTSELKYYLILSNPHDNQSDETHLLDNVKERNPRFVVFESSPSHSNLKTRLVSPDSNTEIRQLMIENAINLEIYNGKTLENATACVAESLLQYHLYNNIDQITSAGGLQDYFKNHPGLSCLLFLKQMDLTSETVICLLIDKIITKYSDLRNITKTNAQYVIHTMLLRYTELNDINCITPDANLRLYIKEGVLTAESLLKCLRKSMERKVLASSCIFSHKPEQFERTITPTDPEIESILNAAINQKNQDGYTLEDAKIYIVNCLIRFHLYGDLFFLTSTAELRNYFENKTSKSPLMFLKQIGLSSEKIYLQFLDLIIEKYAKDKYLPRNRSIEMLFFVLTRYEDLIDIDQIFSSISVVYYFKEFIAEGVFTINDLKRGISKLKGEHSVAPSELESIASATP